MLINVLKRTHDHRANIWLDGWRMTCATLLSASAVRRIEIWLRRRGMGLFACGRTRRMNGDRGRCDRRGGWRRGLTRRESNRDRYGYTHPSAHRGFTYGEGLPDSRTFFIPAAKWRARACLVYGRVKRNHSSLSLRYLARKREDERNNHPRKKRGERRKIPSW